MTNDRSGYPEANTPLVAERTGHVSEMFCSVQGEGLFVGERQIFVRTAGCTATCSWCDTVYSKVQTPRFVIHASDATPARWRPNPVALEDVVSDVVGFAREHAPVATVSITGGEPLEQPEFVSALARDLRAKGFRVHLETAGIHGEVMRGLVDVVDVVAADVKLPSATGVDLWDAHRAFLEALRDTEFDPAQAGPGCNPARTVFVKVIVDLKASVEEIDQAAALVAGLHRRVPFILQPESGTLLSRDTARDARRALLQLIDAGARAASLRLDTVRVIPQTHKVLHVR